MNKRHLVSPNRYQDAVAEAVSEHEGGSLSTALYFALVAGVNAGVLGLTPDKNPFRGFIELEMKWNWARGIAISSNDNRVQAVLL